MASIIGSGLESYVHSRARKRALGMIGKAKAEAQQLIDQVMAEAEAMGREIKQQTAHTIKADQRRAIAQARLEAKQTLLHCREYCLESVWQEAELRLRAREEWSHAQQLVLVERLVADAAAQLLGGLWKSASRSATAG